MLPHKIALRSLLTNEKSTQWVVGVRRIEQVKEYKGES
jgi:hypothetical protein